MSSSNKDRGLFPPKWPRVALPFGSSTTPDSRKISRFSGSPLAKTIFSRKHRNRPWICSAAANSRSSILNGTAPIRGSSGANILGNSRQSCSGRERYRSRTNPFHASEFMRANQPHGNHPDSRLWQSTQSPPCAQMIPYSPRQIAATMLQKPTRPNAQTMH